AIPSRFPACRSQRVPRVFGSALADVNLVPPLLEHDNQIDGGWVDLRAPDSRRIRMALAAIGRAESHNNHLLLTAQTLAVGHSALRCCNSVSAVHVCRGRAGVASNGRLDQTRNACASAES